MVFYFTGTGNSLYVAKQIEDAPISIPQAIHRKELDFSDESIGIVAPIYGHEVPPMVRDFMKKAAFHTDYFYMILTYGNRHGGAAELAKRLCDEGGIDVQYINILWMVDNWLPSFDMDEQKRIDKKVEEQIAAIRADLSARKVKIAPVTDADRAAHQEYRSRIEQMPPDVFQHFIKVGDGCIGCGLCERVCPSGSLRVTGGKAVPIPGRCQTCLACVHACPQKAIGLAVPEKNPNARYRSEHISLNEIIAANHQA